MPAPTTIDEFLELVRKSGVADDKRLGAHLDRLRAAGPLPTLPNQLAGILVRDGLLTHFQAEQFLLGKWRRFTIGKYKVLERLGSGGMGSVYLCEHKLMRRRVAVKVLPTAKAEDPSSLDRFYREARAVAALDHPNIVRAYDIDQDEKLHFLVMEHVDGASLQEIIKKTGPMDVLRVAHYMRQAALGLQHAHETAGLVHRDVKPGNLLVDRNGIVKILDMGLARFFYDEEDDLTRQHDENVLGTADYLAPEQALDSHTVDIRADVYGLGATFYYCLTGRTPFAEGTVAQKLIWHQTRQPKSIRIIRPEVPEGLAAIVEKMLAKDPAHRYQTPMAVADALAPWTTTPIPPPPESEMPQLSLAAMAPPLTGDASMAPGSRPSAGADSSSGARRMWQVPGGPITPPTGASKGAASNPPRSPPTGPSTPQASAPREGPRPALRTPVQVIPVAPGPVVANVNGQVRPATTARVLRGAVKPTAVPAADDEVPSWDKLAPDTDNPGGRADTRPRSAKRTVSGAPRGRRRLLPDDVPLWWVAVGVGVLGVLALVLVLWLAFGGRTPRAATEPPRAPLVVSRLSAEGGPRTLTDALLRAHYGDRIVLTEDLTDRDVTVRVGGLTIEAEAGKSVVWKCPEKPAKVDRLLYVNAVEDFRLRGITLDGDGRTETLVQMYGQCPGAHLQDLHLKGFTRCGILVTNCEGTADRRVSLEKLRFTTTAPPPPPAPALPPPPTTAIAFTLSGNIAGASRNRFFVIDDRCTFDGPGVKIKVKRDSTDAVQFPAGVVPLEEP
jgi:serine/threonine protein kinase